MDRNSDSTAALLTEHLRYAPVSLLDDIINSINDLSYRGVDSVEQGLSAAPPSVLGFKGSLAKGDVPAQTAEEKAKHEIENGAHQLETLLEASIDKCFDIMEIVALRNMLYIPDDLRDWVKLRHYEGLEFDLPPDAPTADSINLQRQKVRESQRLHRLLLAESAKNNALIAQLRGLRPNLAAIKTESTESKPRKSPLAFLSETGDLADGSALAPISTTTSFAMSQLPALKALLADLRPQMKALAEKRKVDPNAAESVEEKSARRERFDYIETQTKKHLETVAGLELGKMGEVVDGEWQGQGRKLNKGEVEDLERVVSMVADGDANDDDDDRMDTL